MKRRIDRLAKQVRERPAVQPNAADLVVLALEGRYDFHAAAEANHMTPEGLAEALDGMVARAEEGA
jgi:hypothetical protein